MSSAVSSIVISDGTSDHIIIDNMVALSNPSSLSVNGSRVLLNVYDVSNVYLGGLVISNLNVVLGATSVLHVLETTSSTSLPELQKALSLVTFSSPVTGMLPPPKLIASGETISTLNTVLDSHQTTFKVMIQSPLADGVLDLTK
ncbi:hypothetical protein BGZ51_000205 [Haplosporangium sp. Z 767]|nr:hypothetical protein BGZ51_000205 [Haplosporangium sp. Z 767]